MFTPRRRRELAEVVSPMPAALELEDALTFCGGTRQPQRRKGGLAASRLEADGFAAGHRLTICSASSRLAKSGRAPPDLGCGRGAVLLMAAQQLTTGWAVGIDLWRGVDQSGNSVEATRRNAIAEGVADRVELVPALPSRAPSHSRRDRATPAGG